MATQRQIEAAAKAIQAAECGDDVIDIAARALDAAEAARETVAAPELELPSESSVCNKLYNAISDSKLAEEMVPDRLLWPWLRESAPVVLSIIKQHLASQAAKHEREMAEMRASARSEANAAFRAKIESAEARIAELETQLASRSMFEVTGAERLDAISLADGKNTHVHVSHLNAVLAKRPKPAESTFSGTAESECAAIMRDFQIEGDETAYDVVSRIHGATLKLINDLRAKLSATLEWTPSLALAIVDSLNQQTGDTLGGGFAGSVFEAGRAHVGRVGPIEDSERAAWTARVTELKAKLTEAERERDEARAEVISERSAYARMLGASHADLRTITAELTALQARHTALRGACAPTPELVLARNRNHGPSNVFAQIEMENYYDGIQTALASEPAPVEPAKPASYSLDAAGCVVPAKPEVSASKPKLATNLPPPRVLSDKEMREVTEEAREVHERKPVATHASLEVLHNRVSDLSAKLARQDRALRKLSGGIEAAVIAIGSKSAWSYRVDPIALEKAAQGALEVLSGKDVSGG